MRCAIYVILIYIFVRIEHVFIYIYIITVYSVTIRMMYLLFVIKEPALCTTSCGPHLYSWDQTWKMSKTNDECNNTSLILLM